MIHRTSCWPEITPFSKSPVFRKLCVFCCVASGLGLPRTRLLFWAYLNFETAYKNIQKIPHSQFWILGLCLPGIALILFILTLALGWLRVYIIFFSFGSGWVCLGHNVPCWWLFGHTYNELFKPNNWLHYFVSFTFAGLASSLYGFHPNSFFSSHLKCWPT